MLFFLYVGNESDSSDGQESDVTEPRISFPEPPKFNVTSKETTGTQRHRRFSSRHLDNFL